MKRARYNGPHDAVDVLLPDGRYETVIRGGQLKADTLADFRRSLTDRDDWTEVDQPTGENAPKGATKEG